MEIHQSSVKISFSSFLPVFHVVLSSTICSAAMPNEELTLVASKHQTLINFPRFIAFDSKFATFILKITQMRAPTVKIEQH
jgi:hypothetical protein